MLSFEAYFDPSVTWLVGYIYFAVYAADTGHKAHKRGMLHLGRIKTVEHGREGGVIARTVRAESYDSVKINRYGGTEHCAYVTNVERA
jgi:hypothetical protein